LEVRRVVLATRNPGKLREIRAILEGFPAEFATADEAGAPEIEETGTTFSENARLKAEGIAAATGTWAIADDSGLEVPALGGEPGVRSARYSVEGTDAANNERLLAEIERRGLDRPAARFVCVIVLATPEGVLHEVRGEVEGEIVPGPRGSGGFGYDPVFFCPELGKTFGESTPEEKAGVSHRGRALRMLRERLMAEAG
jgi:XTP/dITP diphosphohydrolase